MRLKLRLEDSSPLGFIKINSIDQVPKIGDTVSFKDVKYDVLATSMRSPEIMQLVVKRKYGSIINRIMRFRR